MLFYYRSSSIIRTFFFSEVLGELVVVFRNPPPPPPGWSKRLLLPKPPSSEKRGEIITIKGKVLYPRINSRCFVRGGQGGPPLPFIFKIEPTCPFIKNLPFPNSGIFPAKFRNLYAYFSSISVTDYRVCQKI